MPDKLSPEQRHKNMAAIKGKNTKPEMLVRRYLWKHGFRYRLNHGRLPGRPDVVMKKYKTCIFVNGCFWHGHEIEVESSTGAKSIQLCRFFKMPKTNTEFWETKIKRNRVRDLKVQHEIARLGWHCITIWECQLKPSVMEETLKSLVFTLNSIYLNNLGVKRYEFEREEYLQVADDGTDNSDSVIYSRPDL